MSRNFFGPLFYLNIFKTQMTSKFVMSPILLVSNPNTKTKTILMGIDTIQINQVYRYLKTYSNLFFKIYSNFSMLCLVCAYLCVMSPYCVSLSWLTRINDPTFHRSHQLQILGEIGLLQGKLN